VRKIEKAQEDGELGSFLFHDLALEEDEMSALNGEIAAEVTAPPPAAPEQKLDIPAPGPVRPKPAPPPPSVAFPRPRVAKPRSYLPTVLVIVTVILLGAATYLLVAWQADLWPFKARPAETGQPTEPPAASKGMIHVASKPKGAGVRVNEKMRCSTPCVVDRLEIGKTYLLEIQLKGYRTWTAEFTLEKNFEVRRFDATLRKK
jgi:hypothetical protein